MPSQSSLEFLPKIAICLMHFFYRIWVLFDEPHLEGVVVNVLELFFSEYELIQLLKYLGLRRDTLLPPHSFIGFTSASSSRKWSKSDSIGCVRL